MQLILLGAPGVGKGTQAKKIMTKYDIPQISTGEILRNEVKNQSELGKKAKKIMDRGELIPDDIILEMMEKRIQQDDCRNGFILDGFPRTIPQAHGLYDLLKKFDDGPLKVIQIDVPEQEIVRRLTLRRICASCGKDYNLELNPPSPDGKCRVCNGTVIQRNDDTEETIRKRLAVYRQQTEPLVDYYRKYDHLHVINGLEPVEEVFQKIDDIISNRQKKSKEAMPEQRVR
ncbi:MAG: adenylate kinase [Calditrichia bacterium]